MKQSEIKFISMIIFQGQGIVREFHNLSGKIEFLLKCQGDVREF